MKASDLMIGDWVLKPSPNDRESLFPGQIELDDFYLEEEWETITECAPIPLTEDILKKNDFKWLLTESKSITYCINEPTIHVTYYKDSQEWLICVGPSGSIKKRFVEVSCVKYMHELQHALKLCGIEKEIVL